MKHFRTFFSNLILSFIFTLFFGNVFGQSVREYREAHRNLLAKQTRVKDKIKVEESHEYAMSLYGGRQSSTVYSENWDNEKFNPYENQAVLPINIDLRNYVNPVKTNTINSHYGYRKTFGRMHYGVDLKAAIGDTIRSSFEGKVRIARFNRDGYGFYVIIRHPNGIETLYGHLSKFLVKQNQYVKAGQPIALSGNTGRSTGPHLHYEMRYMGRAMNPEKLVDFTTHTVRMASVQYNEGLREGPGAVQTANRNNTQRTRKRR